MPQAVRAHTHDDSRPVKAPSRLAIPSIGVRTNVIRLGLNPDRTLHVPTDYSVAGWYALGPKPGRREPPSSSVTWTPRMGLASSTDWARSPQAIF